MKTGATLFSVRCRRGCGLNSIRFLGLALIFIFQACVVVVGAELPLAWGDQGDGTYKNPILPADFSDPDVIRVGDDFYLAGSDFHFVGIQVLHSRDLVNWRIIGQVFDRLPMAPKYDAMQGYAEGTWAPSLRYHDGIFHLYVCTPHDGLFRWSAKNPAGPWSEMVTIRTVDGWEDPCPFWDDDGHAYLVHSLHGAGPLILHQMNPEGTQLVDDGVVIYRGPVAEGPKLFKRHGWYYISLPEGGVGEGGQTMLRSRQIYGPYERREVLRYGSPHQGGLVELESGEAWFIGFKSTEHLGRVAHLLPVHWGEDDWPVFGANGRTVAGGMKPSVGPGAAIAHPQRHDDFSGVSLSPQWQWNHNPVSSAWSLTERAGWLRLHGQPAAELTLARNTLTQKLWDNVGVVEVKLDTGNLTDGQRAGFAFMSGKVFSAVGVWRDAGVNHLYWDGGLGPVPVAATVWLRGIYQRDTAQLQYSLDGVSYRDAGSPTKLRFGQWKGARVALFAYGSGGGSSDFDDFNYNLGVAAVAATGAKVAREAGEYQFKADSLPQAGVPAGRLEGPFEFHSRIIAGTVRRYWVFVPAQYTGDEPIFRLEAKSLNRRGLS